MSTELKAWLQGLGALAFAAAIAAASLAPPPAQESATGAVFYGVPHADLLLHFGGYLVMTYLAAGAVESYRPIDRRGYVLGTLVGVLVFGVAVELLQTRVPGRTFSYLDTAANAAGAAAGYVIVRRRGRELGP